MRIHLNRKILMLTVLPVLATFGILYSHVQRSIIPNRSTENHTQHERRLKPIDTFNEVTAALQGDVTVEGVVPEKYETDLSEISTENKICPEQLLEQPKSIQGIWYCSECQQITCRKLLFGKVGDPIYEVSRRVMKRLPQLFNAMTRDVLMAQTIACHHFRKLRGYHLESSEEEKEFPIAFTILVHQDVVQTERLLRSIYRPQNVYCLHVDSKFQTLIEDLKNIVKCFDNVFIASKLEDIVYQGFSRLQADINCMRDLLMSITEWKYLLNTAATGFPLKTNLELVKTLKIYNGRNDIKTIRTTGDEFLENRFKLKWVERNGTLRKTNEPYPPPPHNLTIVKGNAYAVFSRAFVEFAIKDQRASDFLEWCRYTMTPDEHFWHTLHSTYANPHINAPGGFSGKVRYYLAIGTR